MNDLIWVGNTLYPRWFIFAALGLAILAAVVLVRGILALIKRMSVMVGPWHIRTFCKCGFDAGQHLGGDLWFARQQFPACPKCARSPAPLENKTVRLVSNGWLKGTRYEEQEPRP